MRLNLSELLTNTASAKKGIRTDLMNLKLFDYAMEPVIYIGEFIVKSFQARIKKADYYIISVMYAIFAISKQPLRKNLHGK